MILIFFGPPGAGKGTQAKFVSKELNIVHLSTGDVLRDQLKRENKLSLELKNIIKNGQLVSDKILNQIVSERITQEDCKKGFILDGYPRTLSQTHFITNYFVKNKLSFDHFFEFNINYDSMIKRITKRSLVEKRNDDSKKTIKIRLDEYNQETKPVLNYFKKQYSSIYHIIDGNQEIGKINFLLLRLLKKQWFRLFYSISFLDFSLENHVFSHFLYF